MQFGRVCGLRVQDEGQRYSKATGAYRSTKHTKNPETRHNQLIQDKNTTGEGG